MQTKPQALRPKDPPEPQAYPEPYLEDSLGSFKGVYSRVHLKGSIRITIRAVIGIWGLLGGSGDLVRVLKGLFKGIYRAPYRDL